MRVVIFWTMCHLSLTLQAESFLAVHMLCTEKRLCMNRVKFLLSMLSALLRYSFEPRPVRPSCKMKEQKDRRVELGSFASYVTTVKSIVYSFRSTRETLDTVLFTIRKFVLP